MRIFLFNNAIFRNLIFRYSPNLGNLSTRINAVTAELKHVMEKLDEIEINEFLDNCPAWHDIDKSDL